MAAACRAGHLRCVQLLSAYSASRSIVVSGGEVSAEDIAAGRSKVSVYATNPECRAPRSAKGKA